MTNNVCFPFVECKQIVSVILKLLLKYVWKVYWNCSLTLVLIVNVPLGGFWKVFVCHVGWLLLLSDLNTSWSCWTREAPLTSVNFPPEANNSCRPDTSVLLLTVCSWERRSTDVGTDRDFILLRTLHLKGLLLRRLKVWKVFDDECSSCPTSTMFFTMTHFMIQEPHS